METPEKPIKPLQHDLSTAHHDHPNVQDYTIDQSDEHPTPINFDHQDDLKLEQIESQIEQIGLQLQRIIEGMEKIKNQDSQNGQWSHQYLELEFGRANLRKRLIDLDFSHKEINYPRLYAKKKKQELFYQELQRQKEQAKKNPSQQTLNKHEAQNQSQPVKKAAQFEDDVISQRSEEEHEDTNSQDVKEFENSTVKFNLQGSQNPYQTSIHNFGLDRINQVKSSQLESSKTKLNSWPYNSQQSIKERSRYEYSREMIEPNRLQRLYIDEKIESQVYKNTYKRVFKETYQRLIRGASLTSHLNQIRNLHDSYLDDYLLYSRLNRIHSYPYRFF